MNKKWLATSLCAVTLFGASFTTAGAASLNKEVKSESNSHIQVMKGDQIQGIALKIIDQIALSNGEFDFNKFKELANKTLNDQAAQKVIKGKKVYKENASKENVSKETSTKAPAKSTNVTNSNKTTAPTNSTNKVEAPAKTPSTNVSQSVSEFEKQVVDLTNAERAKAGLKALQISNPLMNVAQAKSEDMAKNNYFSHTSPTYGSPFDQIKAAGISYRSAGENIAQGQKTPEEVVQAWMNSEGHRANILNGNYTHIGVGYVANGNYWTQQFIQQ